MSTSASLDILLTDKQNKDLNLLELVELSRKGITYAAFKKLVEKTPFNLEEWSTFLNLSERTIQRYQKEKKTFNLTQTEKVVEIVLLLDKGVEVFGKPENFFAWINSPNTALGGIKPVELLDSRFGVELIKDELLRIEHGVLA